MTNLGSMLDSHIDKGAGMNWEDRAYLQGWEFGAKHWPSRYYDYPEEDMAFRDRMRLAALRGWLTWCGGLYNRAPYPSGMRDAALSAFGLV